MKDVAVLVPYRPDGGWRDRTWQFVRNQMTDVQVVEGHDPLDTQPFSMGRAFNNARQQTDAPILALWNADVLWDGPVVAEAAKAIQAGAPYVIPFTDMIRLTRASTELRLQGCPAMEAEIQPGCCNGLTVVAAPAWEDWDERFEGWGPDDLAWRSRMRTHGKPVHLDHTCIHLWHADREHDEAPEEQEAQARSYALYENEYA